MISAYELHVISNGKQSLADFARIAGATEPLVTAFHLREKAITAKELWEGISMLVAAGVPPHKIMVNDRADVAAAAGVCGVHLAYYSLSADCVKEVFPKLRVGKSIHSIEESMQAEAEGADYVLFGHVYVTNSKAGLPNRGIKGLQEVVQSTSLPIIAIGGIKPEHVQELLIAGAAGIAVMSGILEADNPLNAAQAYYQNINMERLQ